MANGFLSRLLSDTYITWTWPACESKIHEIVVYSRHRARELGGEKPVHPSGRRDYYSFGGAVVAMKEGVISSAPRTMSYLHGDHLGSVSLTTNASGTVVSQQRYKPYGELRWASGAGLPTDKQFTSQTRLAEGYVGTLYDYVARAYDPVLGRFISADTIVPVAGSSQAYNRYMYVLGNPLRFTDPTGHDVDCERGDGECHRRVVDERRDEYLRTYMKGCKDGSITQECGFYDLKQDADLATLFLGVMALPTLPSAVRALVSFGRLAWAELGLACGLSGLCTKAAEIGQSVGNGLNGNPTFPNEMTPGMVGDLAILEGAARNKGEFGLGSGTMDDALRLGEEWVGSGYRISSDGVAWLSKDGLRQFRPPTWKPGVELFQANFQWRNDPTGLWIGNGHFILSLP